ncbi:MAG: DUF4407 domain-containing protein [Saprospiraceae bacterium]
MKSLKEFFIFCSGANALILNRTPTEVNKYVGIGATIFFTGIFAAIAAGYALYTVFDSVWLVLPIALLWGFMIFNLDRFIVSTMKKKGSIGRDFLSALPRLILALLIAVVIAKPLELKIFESEIESELVLMQQENYKTQDDLVKARYAADIDSLKSEITLLSTAIYTKQLERNQLVNEAVKEADGTGGSQRRNLGPIYRTKKAASDKVQGELDALTATNTTLINQKTKQINQYEASKATDFAALERVSLSGFAARIEALERVSNKSQAIYIASIFIMLLFIAVETAPVITKLILERSPYDYTLAKHEALFAMSHQKFASQKLHPIANEAKFDMETSDYKTKLSIKAEKELADIAVKERIEELKGRSRLSRGFLSQSTLLGT